MTRNFKDWIYETFYADKKKAHEDVFKLYGEYMITSFEQRNIINDLHHQLKQAKANLVNEKKLICPVQLVNTEISRPDFVKEILEFTKSFELMDDWITVPRLEDIKGFLEWSQVDAKEYLRHLYDCDNFALVTMMEAKKWSPLITFGIAWITRKSDRHVVNCFLVREESGFRWYWSEPQNDKIYKDSFPGTVRVDFILI